MDKILFLVEYSNVHVITYAANREYAKSKAALIIGANPDDYVVTPLTEPGDRIWIDSICLYA